MQHKYVRPNSTFSMSGTISWFLEKALIQGVCQLFQDVCFVTLQLCSSPTSLYKDTKLSYLIHLCLYAIHQKLYLIKIQNYHILSTFVFRSAGLSSESPQVSYVKVNLEQFSYVKVILDKVTRRSNLLNQMCSKNTFYLSVTLQLFWIKGACFGA